jgi:hypothetical protein
MRNLIILSALGLLSLAPAADAQYYQPPSNDPAALVDQWYMRFLGRTATTDRASLAWTNQLRQGASPESVLAGILSSDEYYNRAQSRPEAFIDNLYRDLVSRPATQNEIRFWVQRMYAQNPEDTKTRQDIAYDMLVQHPGSWQSPSLPPPRDRDRDRYDYDYHRPYYPYRH